MARGNPKIAEYGKATQFKPGSHQVEIATKASAKAVEVRQQNADIRKRLREIANMALKNGKIDKIKTIEDAKNANLSVSDALLVKLILMALNGNIKAMNTLMGMLETNPTEAQEAPQSITNSFIEALNNTATEVWADEAPKEE